MAYIKVNQEKVTKEIANKLIDICPFNAFEYQDEYLSINANCRICKMCVKKGPEGTCTLIEDQVKQIDKTKYKGICVFVEHDQEKVHPVTYELIGKAITLAKKTNEKVLALLIGYKLSDMSNDLLTYGVDEVHIYDDEKFKHFDIENYAVVVENFFNTYQNNVFLYGGTPRGRSFAPRVAAKLKTGLTADCTMLDMKENGDLLQIRPAFGGNIMAKIHTPNHRPQMATVRYKMFKEANRTIPKGHIIKHPLNHQMFSSSVSLIEHKVHQEENDISQAKVIIAVGRGFKKQKDLMYIESLRKKLNATVACTRPLVEKGWFDSKKQIGLSGRSVKPELIINLGISGAVQFIEGMKDSGLIISVNQDEHNKLFDVSHYSIIGDLYEILPQIDKLVSEILEEHHV
jgi:electron transfer flavoprotein alpha subunit